MASRLCRIDQKWNSLGAGNLTDLFNWLNGTGGVDFSEGVVEGYDPDDLRDLELRQNQDVLKFRNFYANGNNGVYDAGAVDFASLMEADENGYKTNARPCLVGLQNQWESNLMCSHRRHFNNRFPGQ